MVNSITGWFTYGLSLLFFLCRRLLPDLSAPLSADPSSGVPHAAGQRLPAAQRPESFALVPLGPVFFLLWYITAVRLANLNARVIRSLLGPTEQAQLRARVAQLAASRAETVDTQAGELRRIERDLHDGAQARLVALGMSLGAGRAAAARPTRRPAQQLLAEARETTASARWPNCATWYAASTRRCSPTAGWTARCGRWPWHPDADDVVTVDLPGRLPAPVESAAYFAVAEAWPTRSSTRGASTSGSTCVAPDDGGAADRRVADDGRGGRRPDARHRAARHRPPAGRLRRHADRRTARRGGPTDVSDGAAVRVVIAEDLALLRDGLIRLLEATASRSSRPSTTARRCSRR